MRHGRTALAQRDAIIDEVQARIASSGAAMSTLRAAGSPSGEAGARYDQTLRAWSRNLRRLQRYRDALSASSTFAEIRRAAVANDHARSAFERDGRTVMAGLQALGGQACELEPPPPTPVTHLKDLGGRKPPALDPNASPRRPSAGERAPAKPAPAAAVPPTDPGRHARGPGARRGAWARAPGRRPRRRCRRPQPIAPDAARRPVPAAGGDGPDAEGGASPP